MKSPQNSNVSAIILAAGESRRMAGMDKMFASLRGNPIIHYSIKALNDSHRISSITLVVSSSNLERSKDLVKQNKYHKVNSICIGGQRRQDSVLIGLEKLSDSEWILVQDGARPFIDNNLINESLHAAKQTGSSVAAIPINDTVKLVNSDLLITKTIPRDRLWAAQTPQVFKTNILMDAHKDIKKDVTDDANMIELMGCKSKIFTGYSHNIKITTQEDLYLAEIIMQNHNEDLSKL